MHLENTQEAVLVRRSVLVEAPREDAQVEKPVTTGKREDNKKRKSGDRQRSPDEHEKKAKSPDQRVPRPPLSK